MRPLASLLLLSSLLSACVFAPPRLSDTGLYSNTAKKTLAEGVVAFEPNFVLWSDGAEKRRYIRLPEGERINTQNPDAWVFPVHTQLWKEFERDGVVVETRYLEKMPGGGWSMATYIWSDGGAEAWRSVLPVANARRTPHDVPSQANCIFCHGGTEAPLGFTAVQLAARPTDAPDRLTVESLHARGLLTHAVESPDTLEDTDVPTREALGVFHANCASCHSDDGSQADLPLRLRLRTTDRALPDTSFFHTALGRQASATIGGLRTYAVPGAPDQSLLVARMSARGNDLAMPPIATEDVDTDGLAAVRAFLGALTTEPTP